MNFGDPIWPGPTDAVLPILLGGTLRLAGYPDLREAIDSVARYRHVAIEPLGPLIAGMPALAQRKWETWRRKQRLEQSTPESFAELLQACLVFAEPVLTKKVAHPVWDPNAQSWGKAVD